MRGQTRAWIDWLFNQRPFLIAFIALGAAISALTFYVLTAIDGWLILSRRFGFKGTFYGEVWIPERSNAILCPDGNCSFVGADETGLYLAVFPHFRLWHPPLLIPWSEVSIIRASAD
jgi:hypothetical protein